MIFLLIFIPMALIIGVASSTIGFTAWNIAVPLLFIGFGFDIFDALFISLSIDFANALLLTIIYGRKGKVDFKEGGKWLIPAFVGAFIALLFMEDLLRTNTHLLRGGVSYVIFAIGFGFINKGYKLSKEKKKKQQEKTKTDQKSSKNKIEYEKNGSNRNNNNIKIENNIVEKVDSNNINIEELATEKDTKIEYTKKLEEKNQEKNRKKSIEKLWFRKKPYNWILFLVGSALSGALGGLLGIGNGTNFVLLFIALYGYETLKATGTGVFMMAGLTLFILPFIFPLVHINLIWNYLILAVSFSLIGTGLGAYYALKLPMDQLNYLVGGAMILAATAATIQALTL